MEKQIIFDALEYAVKAHRGQVRKSTRFPLAFHLKEVAEILIKADCSDEIVAAGLLHDTLEDTNTAYESLVKIFGVRIATLVKGASEPNKNDTWENRKVHTIEYLKKSEIEVVLIAAADKLSNFGFTLEEYRRIGDEVWNRFNRNKEKQKWYMQSLAKLFLSRFDEKDPRTKIFKKVDEVVKKLFPD